MYFKVFPSFITVLKNNLFFGFSAVNDYKRVIKESIKRQTEFQPKLLDLPTISNMKTDEIFTNLLIQHGRKPVKDEEDRGRWERLKRYGQVCGTQVKHCQEIFIRTTDGEDNPNSILLTGKAGIGKTLFCQKLIRDWANDKLFESPTKDHIPDFQFAYLLTFRELNLLEDKALNLKEFLEFSSLLNNQSEIDDSLFEHIISHPEEVLIIIDGFDEYSKQDYFTSDAHDGSPNSAQARMPVAALCAKLMNGQILADSVVLVTSRPDEADNITRIRFDRSVEITGFSEPKVKEYVEKYFSKNEIMKNTVLDHILKNEDLVSCAHIPVLCALMCSYMEYILKKSNSTEDLPVSTSELYHEILNIFVLKHSKSISSHFDETTLDKLSEFAARLLVGKKFLFTEGEIKLTLQEVERLRTSGLLHCGPPFRVSFSQTTKHYCFTHLTLHEYLAARWFVKRREIPGIKTVSTMVMQFMAGILSKEKDSELMNNVLREIASTTERDKLVVLTAKCLYEYQDKEFAKDYCRQYPINYNGLLMFTSINDVDCIALSFWLEILTELNEEVNSARQQTEIRDVRILFSDLSVCGIKRICRSLEKDFCSVNDLTLCGCQLNDECAHCLCKLVGSKLFTLDLVGNQITSAGVASLSKALKRSSCKVTKLRLNNNQITDAGVASLSKALKQPSCEVITLGLSDNQITDAGVASLCEALKHPTCKVTTLNLSGNQITCTGVASLCESLNHPSCKVTILILYENHITDAGIASLSEALKHPSCKVTTVDLSYNEITDAGVVSLCKALKHPSCKKVTTLNLNNNQITYAGAFSLCEALKHPNCKVTTLDLSGNRIIDAGVASLCEALKQPSCRLTNLYLDGNQITDAGVASLCEAIKEQNCTVTTLHLRNNQITDAGIASLCKVLNHPSCKIVILLAGNQNTSNAGVDRLRETIIKPRRLERTTLVWDLGDLSIPGI